jgi:hypothetical protein
MRTFVVADGLMPKETIISIWDIAIKLLSECFYSALDSFMGWLGNFRLPSSEFRFNGRRISHASCGG